MDKNAPENIKTGSFIYDIEPLTIIVGFHNFTLCAHYSIGRMKNACTHVVHNNCDYIGLRYFLAKEAIIKKNIK